MKGKFSSHTREVHGFSTESARKASYYYGLAKRKVEKTKSREPKKGVLLKCCICGKICVNIHVHVKKHISDGKKDPNYKETIKSCEIVSPNHVTLKEKKFVCPVLGCASIVKNLQVHLKRCHPGISKTEQIDHVKNKKQYVAVITDASPLKVISRFKASQQDLALNSMTAVDGSVKYVDTCDVDNSSECMFNVENEGNENPEMCNMPPSYNSESSSEIDDANDSDFVLDCEVSTFVDGFLENYLEYLTGIDGADRDNVSSVNEITRVCDLFAAAGLTGITLKPLFDRDHFKSTILIKYRNSDTSKGDKRTNSTMKTYMQYLFNVAKFIIVEDLYEYVGATAVEVHNFQQRLTTIIAKYRNRTEYDDQVRREQESDKINEYMTDENIIKYQGGKESLQAEELLKRFGSDSPPTLNRTGYCMIRRYFFGKLAFRTAHRDGVALNMTLAEFNNVKWDQQMSQYRIKVWKHKTNKSHGSARICVPKDLYARLLIFVKIVRPLVGTNSQYVFIPWKGGEQMQSGPCSKGISKGFQNTNIFNKDVNINCNLIRKKVSTGMNEKFGDNSTRVISQSMAHSRSTAEQHYRRHNIDRDAHEAQNMIASVYSSSTTTKRDVPHEQVVSIPCATNPTEQTELPQTPERIYDIVTETSSSEKSYQFWKPIDADVLQQHFSPPERRSSKDVIIQEFSKIQDKLSQPYTPGKVISEVRRLYGSPTKSDKATEKLPSYLQPKRVTSRGLTTEDEVLLYAKCKHLLKPGAHRVLGEIKKFLSGTNLLKSYSLPQIQTKLTYWTQQEMEHVNN